MKLKIKTFHNSELMTLENVKSFEFKANKVDNCIDITYDNNDTQFIFGIAEIKSGEVEE